MDIIHGYEIVELINAGEFCNSYKVTKSGKTYFLKEYTDPTKACADYKAFVKNQKTMIPLLKSLGRMTETIVEDFEEGPRYFQVKEFIPGGINLENWMEANMDESKRLDVAIQFCEILREVHSKNIVHQDLKPAQVMTVEDPSKKAGIRLILTDFDWSIPNGNIVRAVGTPWYSNIDAKKSFKSDIFTTGIIICKLLTGCNPYNIPDSGGSGRICEDTKWVEWVKKKDYMIPCEINTSLPKNISDIIVKCLEPKAEDRPTLDAILDALKKKKHPLKAKLSASTGDMMWMIPGMSYGRKHFSELFGKTLDDDGNEIYKYLDRSYATLCIEQDGDVLKVCCPAYGKTKNKIMIDDEELTDKPTPLNDGNTIGIFSTSKSKVICKFTVKVV